MRFVVRNLALKAATCIVALCSLSVIAQTVPPDRAAPPGIRPTPGVTLPPAGAPMSRAYSAVLDRHFSANPPQAGECAREIHDRYWTYGPDGKVYPTWHPPVDPITGCAFGHEHGDDPKDFKHGGAGSAYSYALSSGVPFGYANERLYDIDRVNFRDEDHVGHKIMIGNDMAYGASGQPNSVRCGMMVKYHQGTHSPDAMSNNLHEVGVFANCNNGMFTRWYSLQPFGRPGFVETTCTEGANNYGYNTTTAVPPNSPIGGGARNLPDGGCMTANGVNMAEDWPIDHDVILPGGGLFGFGYYFQVTNVSRLVDLTNPAVPVMGRPAEFCYRTTHPGYNAPECVALRAQGIVPWNDRRSPWKGSARLVHFNQFTADDPSARTVWYTDVFGKNASTTYDASRGIVIQQLIRGRYSEPNEGSQIGRDFSHPTVRAPN